MENSAVLATSIAALADSPGRFGRRWFVCRSTVTCDSPLPRRTVSLRRTTQSEHSQEYNNPITAPGNRNSLEVDMSRRVIGSVLGVVMALSIAGNALASSCANVSRAPAPCGWTCTTLVVEGNWVWLPSLVNVGVPATNLPPFWGFIPPGTPDAVLIQTPDAAGNYANGFTLSLLGHSAYCLRGVNADKSHGIVSGCE